MGENMENRKYTIEALDAIKRREYWIKEQDLDILVKPIPETDEAGAMDPRFYESVAPMMKGFKGALVKLVMKVGSKSWLLCFIISMEAGLWLVAWM